MSKAAGMHIVCPHGGSLSGVPAERPALAAVRPCVE